MYMRILFLPFEFMAVHVKCGAEITYLHIMIIILSDKYRLSQPLFRRALGEPLSRQSCVSRESRQEVTKYADQIR